MIITSNLAHIIFLRNVKQSALRLQSKKVTMHIMINKKVLPWVESAKHLGCKITNNIHGLAKDIMEKGCNILTGRMS